MLSVRDANPGVDIAMQVELLTVGPAECYENDPALAPGSTWWVSRARCTDENNHDVTLADPNCTGTGPSGVPNIWRAQLTPGLVCHGGTNNDLPCATDGGCPGGKCGRSVWPVADCVHIADCEVIPIATYAVRATVNPLGPASWFSSDLIIGTIQRPGTKCWADVVGSWTGTDWTCPNQIVNMVDVQAAVFFFKRHPNMPDRTWVELDDESPNMVVNFGDIMQIVNGFQGLPYRFSSPGDCPAEVSPPVPQ